MTPTSPEPPRSGVNPDCPVQRDSSPSLHLGFTPTNSPSRVPHTAGNSGAPAMVQAATSGFQPSAVATVNRTSDLQTANDDCVVKLGFSDFPQLTKTGSPVQQMNPQSANPDSFANITARKASKPPDLFVHNLSAFTPVKTDEGLTVIMPSLLYEQRLLQYQLALIGRIFMPAGTTPRSNEEFKAELSKSFQSTGDWTLLHLGKGFFSLQFRLQEDFLRAARRNSWRLSTGSIHLREWKPNFDPYKESSSKALIWVRLYHLPTEYWHPEFLVGIFRSVGNVIKLDGSTAQGLVGHFARALVEIDLSLPLLDSVRVGLPDNLFFVKFSYENTPQFCSFCHFVGHDVNNCRKAKSTSGDEGKARPARNKKKWVEIGDQQQKAGNVVAKEMAPDTHKNDGNKQKWVETKGEKQQPNRIVPVGTVVEKIHPHHDNLEMSNNFAALHNLDSVEDSVPELTAGDMQNMVTGNSDHSAAVDGLNDMPDVDEVTDSDSGENIEMEQPDAASGSGEETQDTGNSIASEQKDDTVMASPSTQVAATLQTSSMDLHDDADMPDAIPDSVSVTGREGSTDTFMQAGTGSASRDARKTEQPTTAANQGTAEAPLATDGKGMASTEPTASPPQKSIAKRTRNKRKVTENLPKRQLRSSTKNRLISEITPEMIQEYANNQCHYVPAASIGKSKAKQVAQKAKLEDKLRAAAELGRHSTAYVLDTGQTGASPAMNFIANQQWDDITNTEADIDSDSI